MVGIWLNDTMKTLIKSVTPSRWAGHWQLPGLLFALILTSAWLPAASASGDFGLIDHRGDFHQISRYGGRSAVIILAYQSDDAASMRAVREFQALQASRADDQLIFLLLNASDERTDILRHTESSGVFLPVLLDGSQTVAKTLGVESLGEAFVLNPDSQRLVYRGPLANLGDALDQWQRQGRVDPAQHTADGTGLRYHYREQFADRQISYSTQIAPLLQARCAYCHIEDGLAPWPMNRHLMVLGWSPMIRETVLTRRMPPGQIDPDVGDWMQTHNLSDEELALLIEWIDSGAPRDGDIDPLSEPLSIADEWPLGNPDLIIEVPEEQLPATGLVDFRLKRLPLDLPEDTWLQAISYSIGDKSVLHSLLVYALDNAAQIDSDADLISAQNAEYLSVYVPGETDDVFADDSAYLLRSGKDLVVKLRYLTSGRPTVDHTRIGLYFRDTAPEMRVRTLMLDKNDIVIPPESRHHAETLEVTPDSAEYYLESYSPHAHNRGKRMRLSAIYPDGTQELLINVANYNFNWQLAYTLHERKAMPAGTRLIAETVYDNSAANPFNPDPLEELESSPSTWDEMFSHLLRIVVPNPYR